MGVANYKKLPRALVSVDTWMPQQWYKTPSDVAFEIVMEMERLTMESRQKRNLIHRLMSYVAYSASAWV